MIQAQIYWRALYNAAILETDDSKLLARVEVAELAMTRCLESLNEKPRDREAESLKKALVALKVLRTERLSEHGA